MKKITFLLLIFIFSFGSLSSQWIIQQSQVSNGMFGVSYINNLSGMAVGEQG